MGVSIKNDTIAAISTGLTDSGISIVRMSGPDSINIADKLFINKNKQHILKNAGSHTLSYGFFCNADKIIDEVLVSVMRAPHTYTGEDIVEINCHGGIYITQVILNTLYSFGAQSAEPGEFTKRAFLNGKLDLSKAESIMDLIASKNELSRKVSMDHLRGDILDAVNKLRASILEDVAYIESALDDPEHYDLTGFSDILLDHTENNLSVIKRLIDSYRDGQIIKNGIRTVILGKPNAGKSSLMNLLSGFDKSIVTNIPGTTRDILEQEIRIDNIALTLVDTAGIRETSDEVEKIGVSRSLEAIYRSDLIIFVCDASTQPDENDKKILISILKSGIPSIFLLNKCDLDTKVDTKKFESLILDIDSNYFKNNQKNIVSFSSKTSEGMEILKDTVISLFFSGNLESLSDSIIITNERQYKELLDCSKSLEFVIQSIKDGLFEDFYTIDLIQAYESLGYIIGVEIGDDLVNEIFSRFCMGK